MTSAPLPPSAAAADLERASQQALQATEAYAAQLNSYRDQLAACDSATGIPAPLQAEIQSETTSLRRTKVSLSAAQSRVSDTEDELTARLKDVETSVNRKWYRRNPPSNTMIDHAERSSHHFAMGLNLYKLCLILVIGSFAGVVIEMIWCLIRNGYLESRRGLVYGPFNMLYGVGAAGLSLTLYRFRNRGKWLSFLGGMAVGSIVEYACSWFQEALFGSRSWDYSNVPFNLNGRICLLYSVFWGILGVMWIKDIYPRMSKWILKIPNRLGKALTIALTVFLLLDCVVSSAAVYRWSRRTHGAPPATAVGALLDQRFPDERMETIYANMTFD